MEGSHLLFFHTHTLPPKRQRGWKYWECRTTKCLLGCSVCESHLSVQVMECLFTLFHGEWGRSGKGGSNFVGFTEKLYRWLQTVLTHYLAVKWQWSGNGEFESRWLAGQDWLGNKKIEIPFDLCQIFLLMSTFTFAAGLLPVLQCRRGALWHHSASIYCIFSTFAYSSLFQLCIKTLNLLAFSRNNKLDIFVLFFRDSHMSISSLFRVPWGEVFLTISIIVVSTVL